MPKWYIPFLKECPTPLSHQQELLRDVSIAGLRWTSGCHHCRIQSPPPFARITSLKHPRLQPFAAQAPLMEPLDEHPGWKPPMIKALTHSTHFQIVSWAASSLFSCMCSYLSEASGREADIRVKERGCFERNDTKSLRIASRGLYVNRYGGARSLSRRVRTRTEPLAFCAGLTGWQVHLIIFASLLRCLLGCGGSFLSWLSESPFRWRLEVTVPSHEEGELYNHLLRRTGFWKADEIAALSLNRGDQCAEEMYHGNSAVITRSSRFFVGIFDWTKSDCPFIFPACLALTSLKENMPVAPSASTQPRDSPRANGKRARSIFVKYTSLDAKLNTQSVCVRNRNVALRDRCILLFVASKLVQRKKCVMASV